MGKFSARDVGRTIPFFLESASPHSKTLPKVPGLFVFPILLAYTPP